MESQIHINPIIDNYLDSRFQRVLLPFRCLQHAVFLSGFSIKYNCIRPHRAPYYVLSLIAVIGFVAFHTMATLLSKDNEEVVNSYMIFFIRFQVFLAVFPFTYYYALNFIHRKDHVLLILKIQKAFRLINFKQYKKATNRNWVAIAWYIVSFIISVSATHDSLILMYLYTLVYFDVVTNYGICIIALIRDGIVTWLAEVEHYSQICLNLEEEKNNDKSKQLYQAYVNLLEAFDIFKKIFQHSSLFQTVSSFVCSLMYLQAYLEVTATGITHFGPRDALTFEIVSICLSIKYFFFITIFCVYCERYYMSVSEVDASCNRLLRNLQSNVEAKKLCKNVQRLNQAAFEKMTACRMFTVHGRLPLKFNRLVLEYVVVILQFAAVSWNKKTTQM